MSTETEKRVVAMQFDNKGFESGVDSTMKSMQKLNSLDTKGLVTGIETAANGIESMNNKMGALGTIGFTVMQRITNAAINMGNSITNALISPIVEGGKKRALNIEQAKFQFQGLGMDVERSMEAASKAVDGTAYGLDEAAKVTSQLGASLGPNVSEWEGALRGISGVAAMTGSSYEDIGNVFTKVAGQGRLMGDDLLRMSSRGMNVAADLAKAMNITEAEVREMVTAGKLDFKTFSDAMENAYGEHATKANETFTGSLANVKAALARIGEIFIAPAFKEMIPIWNSLKGAIDAIKNALVPAADAFAYFAHEISLLVSSKLGNLWKTTEDGKTIFKETTNIVTKFADALIKVFTYLGDFVHGVTSANSEFSNASKNFENIKRTLAGVSAALQIVGKFVIFLVKGLGTLFSVLLPIGSGMLSISGSLGDVLVKINEGIDSSNFFTSALKELKNILKPLQLIAEGVGVAIGAIFGSYDKNKGEEVKQDAKSFEKLASSVQHIAKFMKQVGKVIGDVFGEVVGFLTDFLSGKGGDALANGGIIGVAILIFKNLKKFLDGVIPAIKEAVNPLSDLTSMLGEVRGALVAWQTDIKYNIMLKIAASILLLSVALRLLSDIKAADLVKSLVAVYVTMQILIATLTKIQGLDIKKIAGGGFFIAISISLLILATALKKLSEIPVEDLGRAMGVMTSMLIQLVGAMIIMEKAQVSGVKGAFSIVIFSAALLILAKAMKSFGSMNWNEIAKGLISMGGALVIMITAMKFIPKSIAISAAGVYIFAQSLIVLAKAMQSFGSMNLGEIAKGLGAMGGALLIMITAMKFIPKSIALTAVGVYIFAQSLMVLSSAVTAMSGLTWDEMGKGLTGLGIGLGIMAVAMKALSSSAAGAAVMILMASGLAILVPQLLLLGTMNLMSLGIALLAMAGAFTIIGVAGALLTPVIPTLLLFGAAVALIGLGAGAAAAGLALLATSLVALGGSGAVLILFLRELIKLLPYIGKKVGEAFVELAKVVGDNIPTLTTAFGKMIAGILEGIAQNSGKIAETFVKMLSDTLAAIEKYMPKLMKSGMNILKSFLKGIKKDIRELATLGVEIIAELVIGILNGFGEKIGEVVDAGFQFIIDFCDGISEAIDENAKEVGEAAGRLGKSLLEGIASAIFGFFDGILGGALSWLGEKIDGVMRKETDTHSPSRMTEKIGVDLMLGLAQGIKKSAIIPLDTAKSVANQMAQVLAETLGVEIPIGLFDSINEEFLNALSNSKSEAKSAWTDAKAEYKSATKALKEFNQQQKLAKLQQKVDKAKDGSKAEKKAQKALDKYQKKLDKAATKAEKKALKAAKKEALIAQKAAEVQQKATVAYEKWLTKYMTDVIEPMEEQYEKATAALEEYNQELAVQEEILESLQNEMQTYKDNIKEAFVQAGKLTAVSAARTANQYLEGMQDTYNEALEFEKNIKALAEMGLDKSIIDDIIAQGVTQGSTTAKYLLDGMNEDMVAALNEQIKLMEEAGVRLGDSLSDVYLQEDIVKQQALVNSMKATRDSMITEMEKLAQDISEAFTKAMNQQQKILEETMTTVGKGLSNSLVKSIKKELGINSPAKSMIELMQYTGDGIIEGLKAILPYVTKAGVNTAETLKNALESINIDDNFNDPVIKPVIDLSDVRKGFDELDNMITKQSIKTSNALGSMRPTGTESVSEGDTNTTTNTSIIQNFNDRVATPQTLYNATKFGIKTR